MVLETKDVNAKLAISKEEQRLWLPILRAAVGAGPCHHEECGLFAPGRVAAPVENLDLPPPIWQIQAWK